MVWKQVNLSGEQLPMSRDKPPEGACTERCFDAEEEKCTCRCCGAYHGLGRLNSRDHPKQEHKKEVEKIEQTRNQR